MLSTLLGMCSLYTHTPTSHIRFLVHIVFPALYFSGVFNHDGKCVQRGQAEEKWNEWEGNLKEEKMKRK